MTQWTNSGLLDLSILPFPIPAAFVPTAITLSAAGLWITAHLILIATGTPWARWLIGVQLTTVLATWSIIHLQINGAWFLIVIGAACLLVEQCIGRAVEQHRYRNPYLDGDKTPLFNNTASEAGALKTDTLKADTSVEPTRTVQAVNAKKDDGFKLYTPLYHQAERLKQHRQARAPLMVQATRLMIRPAKALGIMKARKMLVLL